MMAKIKILISELEDKSKETFQKLEQKEVGKVVRNSEKKIRVIHESSRRPQIYKLGVPESKEGKLPKM